MSRYSFDPKLDPSRNRNRRVLLGAAGVGVALIVGIGLIAVGCSALGRQTSAKPAETPKIAVTLFVPQAGKTNTAANKNNTRARLPSSMPIANSDLAAAWGTPWPVTPVRATPAIARRIAAAPSRAHAKTTHRRCMRAALTARKHRSRGRACLVARGTAEE